MACPATPPSVPPPKLAPPTISHLTVGDQAVLGQKFLCVAKPGIDGLEVLRSEKLSDVEINSTQENLGERLGNDDLHIPCPRLLDDLLRRC